MRNSPVKLAACIAAILLFAAVINCLAPAAWAEERWKFAVLCDTRGGDQNGSNKSCINDTVVKALAQAVVADGCELVIVPGDLVNGWWRNCCNDSTGRCCRNGANGCSDNCRISYEAQFNNWKKAMAPVYEAGIDIYAVRGNHEDGPSIYPPEYPYNTSPDQQLKSSFAKAFGSTETSNGPSGEENLTYSFTHDNALFIGLDEYVTPHKINQAWLNRQLQGNDKSHIFVFGHEPAFQVNHSDCLAAFPENRDAFWESIGAAGGRVYFCGHDHFYNRAHIEDGSGHKIYQVLVGSCGAPFKQWHPPYNDSSVQGDYHNEKDCGYILVTVDGDIAWIEWKAWQKGNWVTRDSFAIKSAKATSGKAKDAKITLTYEGPIPVEIEALVNIFPLNGSGSELQGSLILSSSQGGRK